MRGPTYFHGWLVIEFMRKLRKGVYMIKSKEDYLFYLEADRVALGIKRKKPNFFGNHIWKWQRLLRKAEYLYNCKRGFFWRIYYNYIYFKFHYYSVFLGFYIPLNAFGPGLNIAHTGTIVVNGNAKIGKNCRIHECVNIGAGAGTQDAPFIGNNVFIGPGAKLFGGIKIADNIAIGANAVVNKSFEEPGIGIAGVPAKKINNQGSKNILTLDYL